MIHNKNGSGVHINIPHVTVNIVEKYIRIYSEREKTKTLRIYRLEFSVNLGGNTHQRSIYVRRFEFFFFIIYFYYIQLFFFFFGFFFTLFVYVQTDCVARLSGLVYNPSYLLFPGGIHGHGTK